MRLPRDRFDYSPITSRRPWTLRKIRATTSINAHVVESYTPVAEAMLDAGSGVPHRIKYFEAVYHYMRNKKGVWFTTGEDIFEWYKAGR